MPGFVYEFEWNEAKAIANPARHGVGFPRAAEVFRDPLSLTIADEDHSENEQRWITLGKDTEGRYALVVHTFEEPDPGIAPVRLISARCPTPREMLTSRIQALQKLVGLPSPDQFAPARGLYRGNRRGVGIERLDCSPM
jgi:uncharacterized DUF497 family protein